MSTFSYRKTLVLGFGFLGISILWGIYNSSVPIFLQNGRADFNSVAGIRGYGLSTTLSGFIMTLDNLAALLILPYIGALSDRTRTRWGRRKPYILIGAPIAALAFTAIPWFDGMPIAIFMAAIIITLLAMDVFRTPVISLMPDITPSEYRSQANGVINLMGGVGAVLAFLIGGALFRVAGWAPFAFGAVIMLIACALVIALVREPETPSAAEQEAGVLESLRAALTQADRSVWALLAAIFCWFLGYSALEVFWTSFAVDVLRTTLATATQMLTFFSLSIVVFAVPSGLIGAKFGRKRTIMIGLIAFAAMLAWGTVIQSIAVAPVMLIIAGLAWSLILVNSLPMVVDMAPADRLGTYTGMYYLSSQLSAIVGPVLVGWVIQLGGNNYRLGFVFAPLTLIVALLAMALVRRGEAVRARPGLTPAGESA